MLQRESRLFRAIFLFFLNSGLARKLDPLGSGFRPVASTVMTISSPCCDDSSFLFLEVELNRIHCPDDDE
jgi:hypothetical protein